MATMGDAIEAVGQPPAWRTERLVLGVVEPLAAVLVVVEVLVLAAGVFARYVLNHPLVWSDELASALFLWLAMLGAVIALGRGEHMRLTAVVGMMPRAVRPWLDAFGLAVSAACTLVLVEPALEHAQEQWSVITPALGIHDGLRVAAILVGSALMALLALVRLFGQTRPVHAVTGTAVVLLVCAGCYGAQDWLTDLGNTNLVLFFVGLVGVCVATGTPIAYSFGAATLAYLATTTDLPLSIVVDRIDEGTSELILLAVPMFILLGLLIELMGLAQALIAFLVALLGHVRGGLSYALLGGMYLVSGISGSKAADMAAIAPSLFPGMRRRGAHPGELVAQLAASGAMSETIPPRLVLITVGAVGPGATVPDPRGRGGWRGDRHRGQHGGYRLHHRGRAAAVSACPVAPGVSHAGGHRGAGRRHPADHRHGDRDGLGADPVRFQPATRLRHGVGARRQGRVHGRVRRGVRAAGLGAGGHPRHRAARAAPRPARPSGSHPPAAGPPRALAASRS